MTTFKIQFLPKKALPDETVSFLMHSAWSHYSKLLRNMSHLRFCTKIPTHSMIPHATSTTAWSQSRRKAMTWLHWTRISFRRPQIQRNLAIRQALPEYTSIYLGGWVRLNTVGPFRHCSFSDDSSVMWPSLIHALPLKLSIIHQSS